MANSLNCIRYSFIEFFMTQCGMMSSLCDNIILVSNINVSLIPNSRQYNLAVLIHHKPIALDIVAFFANKANAIVCAGVSVLCAFAHGASLLIFAPSRSIECGAGTLWRTNEPSTR